MLRLLIANLKMLSRNKMAMFWSFMTPIMFVTLFGLFFGKKATMGSIAIINNAQDTTPYALSNELVKQLESAHIFKIQQMKGTIDDAKNQIKRGDIAAALIIPENFDENDKQEAKQLVVVEDPGNAQVNSVLVSFANTFANRATLQMNGITEPVFDVVEEKTNNRDLSYFDFVLAGIIGLSLMNFSMNSIAMAMARYREDQILKRIVVTPIKKWHFIASEVLARLMVNVVQVSLALGIGVYLFNAHIYGNIFTLYAIALLGGILFQLFGFVIFSITKTLDTAQGILMALSMPMMFLGGIFFPIDTLPKWLYSVVQFLPITPLLRIIRGVMLDGVSPFFNPMNISLIFVWIAICLGISIWRFRFCEE